MVDADSPREGKVAAGQQAAQATPRRTEALPEPPLDHPRKFTVLVVNGEPRTLKHFTELRQRLDDAEAATKPGEGIALHLTEVSGIGPRQAALLGLFALKRVAAGQLTKVHVRPDGVAAEILPYLALAATPRITWDEDNEVLDIVIAPEPITTEGVQS